MTVGEDEIEDTPAKPQPLNDGARRSTAKLLQFVEDPGHADEVAAMELDIDMELTDLLEAEEILQRLQDDLLNKRPDLDGKSLADFLTPARRDELDSLLNDVIRRWLGSFKCALADEVNYRGG